MTSDVERYFLDYGEKQSMPLKMTYGDFDIYKWENKYGILKDDTIYAFTELTPFNDKIWRMIKLERSKDPNKNTSDMAAALFHYLVLDLGLDIISDETMSEAGTRFFRSQISRNHCPIWIYDALTGERYDTHLVGQLTRTEPKVKILDPEEDKGWDMLEDGSSQYRGDHAPVYRWFWLASKDGNHL